MKIIIGDYTNKLHETVIHTFNPDVVYNRNTSNDTIVLYAEYLGLSKSDVEFIFKKAGDHVILVFDTNEYLKHLRVKLPRKSKTIDIEYLNKEPQYNPFELVNSILYSKERLSLFEFLCKTKPSTFMPIKTLSSYYPDLSDKNKKVVQLLDYYSYKVKPEILYSIMSFLMTPENKKYFKWRFPKKGETE